MGGLLDHVASFAVQNSYFFEDWGLLSSNTSSSSNDTQTNFPSLFSYQYRTGNFSQIGHSVKSFINTKVARSVFNHYALSVLHPQQKFVMNLNEDLVQLNHYKASCMKAQLTVEQC